MIKAKPTAGLLGRRSIFWLHHLFFYSMKSTSGKINSGTFLSSSFHRLLSSCNFGIIVMNSIEDAHVSSRDYCLLALFSQNANALEKVWPYQTSMSETSGLPRGNKRGPRRSSPASSSETESANDASPKLKRYKPASNGGHAPEPDLQSQRDAATRRLKSVWDSIIERYSEPSVVEQGDIVDLDTGEIVKDNGHLRSLKEQEDDMWMEKRRGRKSKITPFNESKNMFTTIMNMETEEEEDAVATIDEDDEDEDEDDSDIEEIDGFGGESLSTLNLNEPRMSTLLRRNSAVPDVRVQMSRRVKELQRFDHTRTRPLDRSSVAPPPQPKPITTAELLVNTDNYDDDTLSPDQKLEKRFLGFFRQVAQPHPGGFFHYADTTAQELRLFS